MRSGNPSFPFSKLQSLTKLAWSQYLSYLILTGLLVTFVVSRLSHLQNEGGLSCSWLITLYKSKMLFLIAGIGLIPHWFPQVVTRLCFSSVGLWWVASTELYLEQNKPLRRHDLYELLANAETRPIVYGFLFTLQVLVFLFILNISLTALAWALKRWMAQRSCPLALIALSFLLLSGSLLYATRLDSLQMSAEKYMPPWTSLIDYQQKPTATANPVAAARWWHSPNSPLWEDGEDLFWKPLKARYDKRNVVILLLESHRLADVDFFGQGSACYQPSSPNLYRLSKEGIFFTNMIESAESTASAAWSLLTGEYYSGQTDSAFELAPKGPAGALAREGWQVEWLKAAPTAFYNFDKLARSAGIQAGVTKAEKARMRQKEDRYWSAWGMPDEQLFEVALQRIHKSNRHHQPYVRIILTVTNHPPYNIPPWPNHLRPPENSLGGMQYTDYWMHDFVRKLQALPEAQRPMIFITADTGHAHRLANRKRSDDINLERLRIPGLLLLPDGAGAGKQYSSMFTHNDLLDLLAYLNFGRLEGRSPWKFARKHRIAAMTSRNILISQKRCYNIRTKRTYLVQSRWNLIPLASSKACGGGLPGFVPYLDRREADIWGP